MNRAEIASEALSRAQSGQSLANYPAIIQGFIEKGIPASEIEPRINCLTFNAWRALGRFVKKGEHGVKVFTFIETVDRDLLTGAETSRRRPWQTTVFHISQTALADGPPEKAASAKIIPSRPAPQSQDICRHGIPHDAQPPCVICHGAEYRAETTPVDRWIEE